MIATAAKLKTAKAAHDYRHQAATNFKRLPTNKVQAASKKN
jgi:hypothetical protein